MFVAEAGAAKKAVLVVVVVRLVLGVEDIEIFAASPLANEDHGGNGYAHDDEADTGEGRCDGTLVGKEAVR